MIHYRLLTHMSHLLPTMSIVGKHNDFSKISQKPGYIRFSATRIILTEYQFTK
jgi:hypothetical protein